MGVQSLSAAARVWHKAAHGSHLLIQEVEMYVLLKRDLPRPQAPRKDFVIRRSSDLEESERSPEGPAVDSDSREAVAAAKTG